MIAPTVKSSKSRVRSQVSMLCILALLALFITPTLTHRASATNQPIQAPPTPPTAVISITPNVTDTNIGAGAQIHVQVKLASSPNITSFLVYVQFNATVLGVDANSINYAGNILGPQAQVARECIGNQHIVSTCDVADPSLTGPEVLDLGMNLFGNLQTSVPSGLLFNITFSVLAKGFSQVHLLQTVLANGVKDEKYGANLHDGLFTNQLCGSRLCTPPNVSFTFSPSDPSIGTIVSFNATASKATNPNGSIKLYEWFWGEICGAVSSNQEGNATIVHHFCNAQTYLVSLKVIDNYGVSWIVSQSVKVKFVFSDLRVNGAYVDHQYNVLPGTIVHITAGMFNNSTVAVLGTLTIALDNNTVLYSHTFNLTQRGGANASAASPQISWNTANYPVRAWRIDVTVNASIAQNVTSDKSIAKYVQLIVPQPIGLFSLSLLQSSGIGVIVLVALLVGLARFRRKPAWQTEPLTPE